MPKACSRYRWSCRSFHAGATAAWLLVASMLALGCGDVRFGGTPANNGAKTSRWQKGSKAATQAVAGGEAAVANSGKRKKSSAVPLDGASIRSSRESSGSSSGYASNSESQSIDQVGKAIREGLELAPTLVVYLFDRSESAKRLVTSTLTSVKSLHQADDLKQAAADGKLLTAIVGFGEKTDFLLGPPSGDAAEVTAGFDAVKTEPGGREATFAAVKLALEKYAPLRTKERREVVLVLVTDEPGDDLPVLDDAVALAHKLSIPVYAIGPTAPVGKAAPPQAMPNMPAADNSAGDPRTYMPDSYLNDWVSIPGNGYGVGDSYDSGFGPWSLERLCRESGGQYIGVGSVGATYSNRINRDVMAKYLPEYLPVAAMQKSLAENACKQALVDAAKLPPGKALLNPQMIFPKRSEAETKRMLDKAQLDAAKLEENLNKTYDALASAEKDRPKLSGTRWQVAYDTALGRAAAAKVRADGYNAMLAILKRGKNFENPASNTWLLEAAETIETGSAMQKLADKAKTNLDRVKTENPGTPWAQAAEQELRTPLGWRWREQ